MQIGSGTWAHPHLTGLTDAQIDDEIVLLENALYRILGVVPAFIRPPYGETSQTVIDLLTASHGLIPVLWDLDAGDGLGFPSSSALAAYQAVTPVGSPQADGTDGAVDGGPLAGQFDGPDGHLALNLETHPETVALMPTVVQILLVRRYPVGGSSSCNR